MKVIAINGSPRADGASASIMGRLAGNFSANGHEVTRYDLNRLEIRGCQECFICKKRKSDSCAVRDGLTGPLEELKSADAAVIATPVFYGDISAQLKCFIDRTWSYFCGEGFSAGHLPRGRKLVFVMSYGYADETIYDSLWERYRNYFGMFGFDECYLIKARGAVHNSPAVVNADENEIQVAEITTSFGDAQAGHILKERK